MTKASSVTVCAGYSAPQKSGLPASAPMMKSPAGIQLTGAPSQGLVVGNGSTVGKGVGVDVGARVSAGTGVFVAGSWTAVGVSLSARIGIKVAVLAAVGAGAVGVAGAEVQACKSKRKRKAVSNIGLVRNIIVLLV